MEEKHRGKGDKVAPICKDLFNNWAFLFLPITFQKYENTVISQKVNYNYCGYVAVILSKTKPLLTKTSKRSASNLLLAMKLLSKTPKLNQLPKQRKTFISIFSSVPAFSTQVI